MVSRFRVILIVGVLVGMALAGSVQVIPPTAASSTSLGHWEVVRRVDYYSLPEKSLTGDIPPAYRIYMVSLAGFHTDSYGISVGPDDDVRHTIDGGQSWTRATGDLYCRHGLEIVNDSVAWHCGNGGTRISVDSGQTWQTVTRSVCPYMSFLDEQTGWTASPSTLQVTTDGGTSWNDLTLPLDSQRIAAVVLRTTNDGYVLDTAGNLFVTDDGGWTWDIRSLGLNPGEQLLSTNAGPYTAMRFLDARRGMVVFVLSDQSVWFAVTEDDGQSWERAEIPELRGQSSYYHLYLSQDSHLLTVTDSFINGENASVLLRYRES